MAIIKVLMLFYLSLNIFQISDQIKIGKIKTEKRFPVKVVGYDSSDSLYILNEPVDLCYNKITGKIYVFSAKDYNVKVFDDNLKYIEQFGRYGQGPVEFLNPEGIDVNKNGNILITEWTLIKIIDKEKKCLTVINTKVAAFAACSKFDNRGYIYINDVKDGFLLSVYDMNGNLITRFGDIYQPEYESFLLSENNVLFAIDDKDNIYCCFYNCTFALLGVNMYHLI